MKPGTQEHRKNKKISIESFILITCYFSLLTASLQLETDYSMYVFMPSLNTEPMNKLGIFGTYLLVLRRWEVISSLNWHVIHFDYKIKAKGARSFCTEIAFYTTFHRVRLFPR